MARKSRKKLGKLRKKEALQQRQQPSGGAEKPGAGHTVTGGVFAKTESEPGGAEGKSGQSGAGVTGGEGVSRALGSGAAAAEAALDQEGTQASGRGKYPRKRGGEWVGNGGNARESGVERMAEGRITGPNGVVAEADTNVAVVIPAGSGASGLVKAGPGPDGSGKPTVSERSKVSGAPVMKEAVLRTGHEKILSEEPVILGGDGHELAPAKRKGPVLAQGKVGGLSEPHQNSANVSNDTARSEKSGAPVTIAPGDSTAGAQVGAKPGERKDEGGVPRLKGQSEAVRGLEEGISQPTSGVESRTEGVGQGNGGARDAEVLGLWETMTVTGKRKAVGGTESAASKKQAVGSVGEAGASKGLREDIPKGGGSQRTESSSSAIARTEPALSEREAGPRFQPGVSRAQSERGLLAKQESVKSVGVSGVGNEGRPASSGFNNAAQLSDEKSLRLEKGGGTGAQVLAQRLEPSAAKVVQKATPSAIFQTAPPLAVPSSARRSPPGGGVSETLPLVSAPPGVAKPPAVDAGFLAELRAKALASQQKKASEATVKPSESTVKVSETTVGVSARTVRESEVMVKPSTSAVKPSGTTVKASGGTARGPEEAAEPCGATIRVSKPTVRVAEGKARASETVVKSLGTTAKAFETVKQCAAVVATASRTATTPSKGAAKWSEGAETVSEGAEKASEAAEKASEAAAPVRASQWTAVASAALISARTTSAGTIPNKPTGVSEAGSQQLTGKSPAVPTLSLGPNPAAATISPAKASPPIGLPQPAPGQNAGQANPPLVSRPVFPGAPKPALHFGSAVKSHSTTDPPKVKPPHSQPGLPVTSSSPLKTAVLSAPQASAFGRTAPFISGALGTNLAFGSGATSKPGPSAPLTGSRPVLAQSLHEGIGGHSLPGSQTAEPPGKGAPEDALAATIKALRESIQRQSHVGFPSPVKIAGPKPSNQELPRGTEGALPGGGAPEQTRRLAYIKKRKNVLVRRVTPQRGTLTQSSRPDSASESGAGLSGNKGAAAELSSWGGASAGKMTPGGSKRQVARGVGRQPGGTGAGARKTPVGKAVHQRKALSWQRASAAPGATSTASPHTPLLQGPRRKQGARFASPQPKRGLTWKLGGPVAPGGSPKLGRNTLRMPGRGSRGFGKLSAKKTGVWGAAKAGKLGGAQSAVKRRAALKWSREKGTARTPGRASPLPISNEKGSLLTLLR